MSDRIPGRLASLPKLSKTDLHSLWKELFQKTPPPHLRRDLMIPILGYRLQEQAFGSVSAHARRRLSMLARTIDGNPNAELLSSPGIKAGTRLVRHWKDKVHVVHAEAKGYEYKGSHYDSLSEIARLITGTRWSGPLFFGLKNKRATNSKEVA